MIIISNTRDSKQLLDGNLEEVKAHHRLLLNNQFVLTPGVGGFGDIVKLIFGVSSLQPAHLANDFYNNNNSHSQQELYEFFAHHSNENWNLVSFDFIDLLTPAIIISVLVGLNFSSFHILLATIQYDNGNNNNNNNNDAVAAAKNKSNSNSRRRPSIDVTSKVQSHILRGKCLFLNVGKDFGTSNNSSSSSNKNIIGTLTLAYRVLDKFYSNVIHFNSASVIVLNEYNHIQSGSNEILIGKKQEVGAGAVVETGTIDPGDGGTNMNWTMVGGGGDNNNNNNGGDIVIKFDIVDD